MSEEGKSPQPASASQAASLSLEEFQRLDLRVGVVTEARDHPNADRLLVLTVDLGAGQLRQLVAGIRQSYQAADLVGRRVVVLTNLKPATLRGIESQGMVLAASDGTSVILLTTERPVPAGSRVA